MYECFIWQCCHTKGEIHYLSGKKVGQRKAPHYSDEHGIALVTEKPERRRADARSTGAILT